MCEESLNVHCAFSLTRSVITVTDILLFLPSCVSSLIWRYPSDVQDFRDAVTKASRQSGKPVIEERHLNQILYYLPQLYELNQYLLKEFKERVASWYASYKICLYTRVYV